MGTKAYFNASGHLVTGTDDTVGILAGLVKAATGVVTIGIAAMLTAADEYDVPSLGTEAEMAAIAGIAKASAAAGAACEIYPDGEHATALGLALTPGLEYWIKRDGTLVTYANVTAGDWTRTCGVATAAGAIAISLGPLQQKPA